VEEQGVTLTGRDAGRHSLLAQRVHHRGDVDIVRAAGGASVTAGAQPDVTAAQTWSLVEESCRIDRAVTMA
jgi:hypothetical protein